MAQFAIAFAISTGVSLATAAASYLLTPSTTTEGPRLNDLNAPKSNYGVQIPKIYGRGRVGGNLIWSTKIKEVSSKKKAGKGFGPKTTQKTYTYYGSFAMLLCQGPIVGVRKIWLNSKLVYDKSSGASTSTKTNSQNWAGKYLRIYTGTATQGPDPLIQSIKGADTPAYRHRAYLVFENLPLEKYNNAFPQMSVEVVTKGTIATPQPVPVSEILQDICANAGLTTQQIDTSEIEDTVDGFIVEKSSAAKELIEQLQQAFFFDMIESEGKVRFLKVERPTIVASIGKDDLAAHEYGTSPPQRFKETRVQELELPPQVVISYFDASQNYAQLPKMSVRHPDFPSGDENRSPITLPMVLSSGAAQQIADRLMALSWLRRRKFSFSLLPKYNFLEPGDAIEVDFYGYSEKVQITKINRGANLLLEVEAHAYGGAALPSFSNGSNGSGGSGGSGSEEETGGITNPPVLSNSTTTLKILDIPLIADTDTDNGLYVAADGDGDESWTGAALYVSRNNGVTWDYASTLELPSTFGVSNTVLAANSTSLSITVREGGEILGSGKLLVGSEILYFSNFTLTATRTYTLSGLSRGRRGTEWAIASHTADEPVYLLSDYLQRVGGLTTDIGQTLQFKALTGDATLDEVDAVTITPVGNSLKPYSPVNPSATKDAAGNITLTWTRRDRKAGDRTDYANFPLSEVSENYDIEILNGVTVVRTLTSTSPNITYTAAQQTADFGALQTAITFKVYQKSALVGRGTPAQITLTPGLVYAVPKITGFAPTQGSIGGAITVYGTGFTGATSLAINGALTTNLTVISDTQATGTIALGTTSGLATITTPGGTASSPTAFTIVPASSGGTVGREILQSIRNYYVSFSIGNDNNNGLSITSPFATIQKAIDVAASLDIGIYDCIINVADHADSNTNPINSAINLKSPVSTGGRLIVRGNIANPSNCRLNLNYDGALFVAENQGGTILLEGFRLQCKSGFGGSNVVSIKCNNSYLLFQAIDFGNNNTSPNNQYQIQCYNNGIISPIGNYSISGGNFYCHIGVFSGKFLQTVANPIIVTLTNTPAFASFLYADTAGVYNYYYSSLTWSGSATGRQFEADGLSLIRERSNNPNYFPGNQNGVLNNGSIKF